MPAEWRKAPQYIIDTAKRLIEAHHPELLEARIAFLMRSEASKSNGLIVMGRAKKMPAELQVIYPFDFVIWLASDEFSYLSPGQREALIDHQLCHLQWIDDVPKIKGHDFDGEFLEIINRHGLWWPRSDAFAVAVQAALPIEPSPDEPKREGSVGTFEPSGIDFGRIAEEAQKATWEQVADGE